MLAARTRSIGLIPSVSALNTFIDTPTNLALRLIHAVRYLPPSIPRDDRLVAPMAQELTKTR